VYLREIVKSLQRVSVKIKGDHREKCNKHKDDQQYSRCVFEHMEENVFHLSSLLGKINQNNNRAEEIGHIGKLPLYGAVN